MKTLFFSVVTCALVPCLAACFAATDDAGESNSTQSGLSATVLVSELTPTEVHQFCEWVAELFPAERSAECGGSSLTFSAITVELCEQQYERVAADCQSSVEEVEACFLASMDDLCLLDPSNDAEVCAGYHACGEEASPPPASGATVSIPARR